MCCCDKFVSSTMQRDSYVEKFPRAANIDMQVFDEWKNRKVGIGFVAMLTLAVVFAVVVDPSQFDGLQERSKEVEREDGI